MTRVTRLLALTGALACGGLGLAACGSSVPGDSVAVVGSTPISKATYAHWLNIAARSTTPKGATAYASVPDPPEYTNCIAYLRANEHAAAPLARQSTETLKSHCAQDYAADKKVALSFLLAAAWDLGQAKELGVKVSDKEVEKEFDTVKKSFGKEPAFKRFLAGTGYTLSDVLYKVKVEKVLPPKIEKAVIARAERSITPAFISNYYHKHLSAYYRKEGRELYILLAPSEAEAKALKAEVEAGKSFKALGSHSILHTSQGGGVFLVTERGRDEKQLEGPLFAAKTGVVTGPVKTPSGYYVFQVKKKVPARQETLAEAESRIRSAFVLKKIEHELGSYAALAARKWRAKTTCAPGYVVTRYCKTA
jgi:foldase protein PrsA